MSQHFSISGNIVDVVSGEVFPGTIMVENGRIREVIRTGGNLCAEPLLPQGAGREKKDSADTGLPFILPGFIDAHVHIESSMLTPAEFARLAVVHGTVGTVSDPHEIANVIGLDGVRFMIENGRRVPFRFSFGAPSCVPATPFESSGAVITPDDIKALLQDPEIKYLSEMMNYPGVIGGDPDVAQKLAHAHDAGKVIDGHIPGISGEGLQKYASAGISTDHECFSLDEALEKIGLGMKILIREGSAAKNFDDLSPLLSTHPGMVMFCSDDKHPDDLIRGHMNLLIRRAMAAGYGLFDVLRAVTLNPVKHYKLEAGLLQPGDQADFVVAHNLTEFRIMATYIGGKKVAENGRSLIPRLQGPAPNRFHALSVSPPILQVPLDTTAAGSSGSVKIRVIRALDGQLVTRSEELEAVVSDGLVVADPGRDILKLVAMNRYRESEPAVAFIRGFGLKRGALASTVAHDSHNIISVGCSDEDIAGAINLLVENKGGISIACGGEKKVLPLPVAGIMTNADGYETARLYKEIDRLAKQLGSTLTAPFMTLSFMALLVIPDLKLSDRGLFDGTSFQFTSLFCAGI
jgi:adenine deaminase